MKNDVYYRVSIKDPVAHILGVELRINNPNLNGQVVSLPTWIPGSYMIREFARNIVKIGAIVNDRPILMAKLDKNSWQVAPCEGLLIISYEVYAWDLSVRAAHLDQNHGFFNGTSVFLQVHGQEKKSHIVELVCPDDAQYQGWKVATSLPEYKAKRYEFGTYRALNYDELIDHPIEMGSFTLGQFEVYGVKHDVVISGFVPNLDLDRLCADLKKICATQITFFEPKLKRAPVSRYVFLVMTTSDGYGGLEHRASTALICKRGDLPSSTWEKSFALDEGYKQFLGLCSHEYFHTWNVKRVKPAAFAPYDLDRENYTSLLWLFEGFTSYYDDLMLVRSGLISEEEYLKILAKTLNGVLQGVGRLKQSVAESSFDAWIKYYRQDENAPNAIVSYYTKGMLVALGLDLLIRKKSAGKKTLDDALRIFWNRFGRDFYTQDQRGITEGDALAVLEEVAGSSLKTFFNLYIYGTCDLPLTNLFAPFGVRLVSEKKALIPVLGASIRKDGDDLVLSQVYEGGTAYCLGLSAGDTLIALDGLQIHAKGDADPITVLLKRYAVGQRVAIHVFRNGILFEVTGQLQADKNPRFTFSLPTTDKEYLRRPTQR